MSKDLAALILPNPPSNPHKIYDWESLFIEAKKEEVFPLFYRTIKQDESLATQIPKALQTQMNQLYYTHIAQNALLLEHLKKIVVIFNQESVDYLLFKGFDLAARIYGDLWSRSQCDLDFIIHPKDLERAKNLIQKDPIVELEPNIINLKRFSNKKTLPEVKGWRERKTTTQIENILVSVPNMEDLFLALCIHFVFHHHLRGLKWLTDLAWMTKQFDWDSLIKKTKENHLEFIVYATLEKLGATFPVQFPEGLLKSLETKKKPLLFFARWNTKPTRYIFRLGLLATPKTNFKFMSFLKYRFYLFRYFIAKWHEKCLGLDTWKSVEISKDRFYAPTHYKTLKRIFKSLKIKTSDVFIDFGSGKGRVLIAAAKFPFKKIIGVDISEMLNNIAKCNIKKMESKISCKDILITTCEATSFELPDDVTIAYCYNSFYKEALFKVMTNIKKSLEQHPRKFTFIYNNPVFHEELENFPWLRRVSVYQKGNYELYHIYEYSWYFSFLSR